MKFDPEHPFAGPRAEAAFRLKERINGRTTLSIYHELRRSEKLPRSDIIALRSERLRDIVAHARANVPYYADAWRNAHAGAGLSGVDSLDALPLLTRDDIRANFVRLHARGAAKTIQVATSGSTGARLVVEHDANTSSVHLARAIRAHAWWGLNIGDKEVRYWGNAAPFTTGRAKARAWMRRAKDRAMGATILSPFDLSPAILDEHLAFLDKEQPSLLFGYGGALYALARHMRKSGRTFQGWTPTAVIYTSETLHAHQKDEMEEAFGRRPASEYGTVECGLIAYECPHGRMHLSDETLAVEVIPATGRSLPKGWGEIVVTHLSNRSMPLIRYKIGDLGVLSEDACPCGRPLGVLRDLVGRSNDLLEKRNGDLIHPELFDYFMRAQPSVRRYRVIEKARGTLHVLAEPEPDLPPPRPEELAERLAAHLGGDVTVTAEIVSQLEADPSGKFRWVVPLRKVPP